MKKLKKLSVALAALSTLLICKSAKAQYMRPVPIYVPPPYLHQFDPRNNSQTIPNSSSSAESLTLEQKECLSRAINEMNSAGNGVADALNKGSASEDSFVAMAESMSTNMDKISRCTK